ncbi:MAG: hypothetical protein GY946_19355, partial [bacterium]|nr:hypothetical protein [bacterium]
MALVFACCIAISGCLFSQYQKFAMMANDAESRAIACGVTPDMLAGAVAACLGRGCSFLAGEEENRGTASGFYRRALDHLLSQGVDPNVAEAGARAAAAECTRDLASNEISALDDNTFRHSERTSNLLEKLDLKAELARRAAALLADAFAATTRYRDHPEAGFRASVSSQVISAGASSMVAQDAAIALGSIGSPNPRRDAANAVAEFVSEQLPLDAERMGRVAAEAFTVNEDFAEAYEAYALLESMRSAAIDAARQEYNGRTINTEQAEAIADGVVGEIRGVLTAGSGVNVLGPQSRREGIELAGSSGGNAKGLDRFHAEVAGNRAAAAALEVLRASGVDALSETGGPVDAWRLVEATQRQVAEAVGSTEHAEISIKAQVEAYREMENVARTAIRERMRGDIENHQSLQRRAAETAADAFFEEFERAR